MIRISVSHGRRVPDPAQDYATRSFSASIDAEVCESNPEAALKQIHALWNDLQRAVDERVAALQPDAGRDNGSNGNAVNGANGNGYYQRHESQPANGNGNGNGRPAQRQDTRNGAGISRKQLRFASGLARKSRLSPADLDAYVRETFSDPTITLRDLSKKQASQLIEQMLAEGSAA